MPWGKVGIGSFNLVSDLFLFEGQPYSLQPDPASWARRHVISRVEAMHQLDNSMVWTKLSVWNFFKPFLEFLRNMKDGLFWSVITVPILLATSVQVYKPCSNVSKMTYIWQMSYLAECGWNMDSACGTVYPVWRRPWLFLIVCSAWDQRQVMRDIGPPWVWERHPPGYVLLKVHKRGQPVPISCTSYWARQNLRFLFNLRELYLVITL